jgi:glycosyltransferase involved in cell wall biosynthesis
MLRKTFILIPNLSLPGGVSNFYKVAENYFSNDTQYVCFNSKWRTGLFRIIFNLLAILSACIKILIFKPKCVVVNPSLHKNALLRDGLFLLWSHMFEIKTIVFWHGWNPTYEYLFDQHPFRFLLKYAYLKANQHIVLNNYTYKFLVDTGVESSAIKKGSTLVDDSFFKREVKSKRLKDRLSVLFLTRVEKYKGIYEALELIREFKESEVELHIVGDGSELEKVKKYIVLNNMDNVFIHGFLSGEAKLNAYLASDLYLFPSYSEGMPTSLLEAMGSGLPVLCTNVGAMKDFFVNGKMGFSHDLPIDNKKFKNSLDFFLNNPEQSIVIGQYNREYAENFFKASKVTKQLEHIFYEL